MPQARTDEGFLPQAVRSVKATDVKKDFDCIQFKHQAQARIYERIKGLPLEKEIEYFRNAADEGPPGDWRKAIKARAGPSPGT